MYEHKRTPVINEFNLVTDIYGLILTNLYYNNAFIFIYYIIVYLLYIGEINNNNISNFSLSNFFIPFNL